MTPDLSSSDLAGGFYVPHWLGHQHLPPPPPDLRSTLYVNREEGSGASLTTGNGFKLSCRMSYGGLRGAVAFAMAASIHNVHVKPKFMACTLGVILFTVFAQGSTVKFFVGKERRS
jgi:Sodium/hydrogen exchanger family